MLKWLAIVALALTLAQKPLPVQGQNQQNQAQSKTSETSSNTPAIFATEVNKENAEKAQRYAYYKAHPKEYVHNAFAPAYLSNWVLAGLGIIGGVLALGTLFVIKRQADHLVISERAWLVIGSAMQDYRPTESIDPRFDWSILNTGKTPARITETQCTYEMVYRKELYNLPSEPPYTVPIELRGYLLPPGDLIKHSVYLMEPPHSTRKEELEQGDVNTIRMGLYSLRVYGYVKYVDAFGKKRESRFCEHYVWPNDGVLNTGFRPLLGIPAAYTKHT